MSNQLITAKQLAEDMAEFMRGAAAKLTDGMVKRNAESARNAKKAKKRASRLTAPKT